MEPARPLLLTSNPPARTVPPQSILNAVNNNAGLAQTGDATTTSVGNTAMLTQFPVSATYADSIWNSDVPSVSGGGN